MYYKCDKCESSFKSKKYLKAHELKKVPCDLVCRICNEKLKCRRSYYYHLENEHLDVQHDLTNPINNVISYNTNNSNNTSTTNNTLVNDVKNVVMLHPLGLTYHYMNRDEVITPVNGTVLDLVRKEEYKLAYITMFQQIHGNPEIPEHHNIYVKEKGTNEVYVFNGRGFQPIDLQLISADMYERLRGEMRWAVKRSDADEDEKDQLMWNIQADWMYSKNFDANELMEQVFFNNKIVVEDTFKKSKVYTDLSYIAKSKKCAIEDIKYDNSKPLTLPV